MNNYIEHVCDTPIIVVGGERNKRRVSDINDTSAVIVVAARDCRDCNKTYNHSSPPCPPGPGTYTCGDDFYLSFTISDRQ